MTVPSNPTNGAVAPTDASTGKPDCMRLTTVSADGKITNESIQTSSGFPRLDDACLKGVHGQRMMPATENGKPVEKTVSIPIVWKLTGK